jgi:mono/diheme cytochrome c family protein
VNRARVGSLLSASLAVMTAASLFPVAAGAGDHGDASSARGREVFQTYCVLCHGSTGKGDGRAAQLQKVRPSDLTVSSRSDDYKLQIISNGGAAMKRSEGMPPWKSVLSREQLADLVAYLRVMVDRGTEAQARAEAKP